MQDDFMDLLDRISTKGEIPHTAASKPERPKFPCQACHGTGIYHGVRRHQPKEGCFACGGKGFFYTSHADRMEQRQKRAEKKRTKLEAARTSFKEENPGLVEFLQSATWSNFAQSLYIAYAKYGSLTDGQLQAAISMRSKAAQREAVYEAERLAKVEARQQAEATATPTLAVLAKAFLTSSQNLKHPKLRLRTEDGKNVVLSRAGAGSRNPGHIFVTDGGAFGANTYYGRLTPDGKALWREPADLSVVRMLEKFNADPSAEMLVQGQRTGCCCLCGRELTKADSVERGVGPICAGRWGL